MTIAGNSERSTLSCFQTWTTNYTIIAGRLSALTKLHALPNPRRRLPLLLFVNQYLRIRQQLLDRPLTPMRLALQRQLKPPERKVVCRRILRTKVRPHPPDRRPPP